MKPVYGRALRLVETGQVDVRGFVSHRFRLEDCSQAFTVAAARQGLKVVVEP
jgi:L-iditol 2-dehydrogenase